MGDIDLGTFCNTQLSFFVLNGTAFCIFSNIKGSAFSAQRVRIPTSMGFERSDYEIALLEPMTCCFGCMALTRKPRPDLYFLT